MSNDCLLKKHIDIVGIGTGRGTIIELGIKAINGANVIIGARRMLEICEELISDKITICEYDAKTIRDYIEKGEATSYVILVSGDTGFYSATLGLLNVLGDMEIRVIPGISSVSSMSARIGIPWQDMKLISFHGRVCNLVDTVRRNRYTFALTGGNIGEILPLLAGSGYQKLIVYIGQKLDMDDEVILSGTVEELMSGVYDTLSVMVIVNENYDDRIKVGIEDDCFIRGDVPMTKSEVRAVTLSKLMIEPDDICYDYGCGTGSVTVEMALAAYRGHVFAIDKNQEAVRLTEDNVRHFHIGNVTVTQGRAPKDMEAPVPDKAFIGGSTGSLKHMVEHLVSLNPSIRIVINAIAIETLSQAVSVLEEYGFNVEITQVGISRSRKVGNLNMLMAENSVYIIKGERI